MVIFFTKESKILKKNIFFVFNEGGRGEVVGVGPLKSK